MKGTWTRRDFLRNATLASLLAPVTSFWPDLAGAQATARRTNMVLIFLPNGKTMNNVFVHRTGGGWSFGPGFEAYEPFWQDLVAFDQYSFEDFQTVEYDGEFGGHVDAAAVMFSGEVPYTVDHFTQGMRAPSIDQIVAWDYLRRGVITDPLRKSLNIRISGSSTVLESVFAHAPPDYALNKTYTEVMSPVSMIDDPREGFDRMFGGFARDSGSTIDRLWGLGKSILDVPAAELRAIRSYLPREGNTVLDEHMQYLREVEQSLASEPATQTLEQPPRPDDGVAVSPDNHEAVIAQWHSVIEASLRFDRTRIVTMQYGGAASRFEVPSLGAAHVGPGQGPDEDNSGTDFHSYTHWQPDSVPLFLSWFSERVAELLTALRGDGSPSRPNILDDSAVMVGCEFGWNHHAIDVPVLLAGKCGGYFHTGQVLTYGRDVPYKHMGTLLSVCHAMGVTDLTRVGNPKAEYQHGPVAELRA